MSDERESEAGGVLWEGEVPLGMAAIATDRWRLVPWDRNDSGEPLWQIQDPSYPGRWYDRCRADSKHVHLARALAAAQADLAAVEARHIALVEMERSKAEAGLAACAVERDDERARAEKWRGIVGALDKTANDALEMRDGWRARAEAAEGGLQRILRVIEQDPKNVNKVRLVAQATLQPLRAAVDAALGAK